MKTVYVIIHFNTEEYTPIDIASAQGIYDTFEEALEHLIAYAEEDGFDMSRLDKDEGIIIGEGCHRGYYIQEQFVNA